MGLPMLAESPTTRIDKNLTIYTDVMRQLDMNYVDTLNYDDLIESSINYMLKHLGAGNSAFFINVADKQNCTACIFSARNKCRGTALDLIDTAGRGG